jgi:hypothetical protein
MLSYVAAFLFAKPLIGLPIKFQWCNHLSPKEEPFAAQSFRPNAMATVLKMFYIFCTNDNGR